MRRQEIKVALLVLSIVLITILSIHPVLAQSTKPDTSKVPTNSQPGKDKSAIELYKIFVAPAVGAVIMLIGGLISWILQTRLAGIRSEREKLRAERRKIYVDLLSPFIRLFAAIGNSEIETSDDVPDDVMQEMLSFEYKKTSFEMALFGSDEVVNAYNVFMGTLYESAQQDESAQQATQNPMELMQGFGELLLEIRKSLGNEETELNRFDMLRWMIKDIDNYIDKDGKLLKDT